MNPFVICKRAAKLQWGRDQLIAEFKKAAWTKLVKLWLQWGRDQLIAELGLGSNR